MQFIKDAPNKRQELLEAELQAFYSKRRSPDSLFLGWDLQGVAAEPPVLQTAWVRELLTIYAAARRDQWLTRTRKLADRNELEAEKAKKLADKAQGKEDTIKQLQDTAKRLPGGLVTDRDGGNERILPAGQLLVHTMLMVRGSSWSRDKMVNVFRLRRLNQSAETFLKLLPHYKAAGCFPGFSSDQIDSLQCVPLFDSNVAGKLANKEGLRQPDHKVKAAELPALIEKFLAVERAQNWPLLRGRAASRASAQAPAAQAHAADSSSSSGAVPMETEGTAPADSAPAAPAGGAPAPEPSPAASSAPTVSPPPSEAAAAGTSAPGGVSLDEPDGFGDMDDFDL